MDMERQTNDDQSSMWNGSTGCAWVDEQGLLDHVLEPFEHLLVQAVFATSAARLLDVGCGTGGTTVALARLLGAQGRCVGIDISDPMLAAARVRAERAGTPAQFICADAQVYAFEPGSFDAIVSRFGVMFFDDSVAAFANLRRAARADAGLRIIAWRSAADNPFMTTAERAAGPLLPNLPPREPDAPGQFAFADRNRVRGILEASGWAEIDIRPLDVTCRLPESRLVNYFSRFGPLGRVLAEADPQTQARVVERVRPAFDPYVHGDEVRFDAACWMIGARATANT
jgi:SAM-dependent methyltransferase